ncbi:hypothetical protein PVK06_048133 [Gossypium arboreum]|uniref:Uncharacterized protein n=1 Tax=Gossypium arboreum TaxID=29729 RepID=A0ABR0MF74_GOSAR|nr:hypothetical protein PVK06_048133 [Gossypium arboreum]
MLSLLAEVNSNILLHTQVVVGPLTVHRIDFDALQLNGKSSQQNGGAQRTSTSKKVQLRKALHLIVILTTLWLSLLLRISKLLREK